MTSRTALSSLLTSLAFIATPAILPVLAQAAPSGPTAPFQKNHPKPTASAASEANFPVLQAIHTEGNQRIEPSAVATYLGLKVGEQATPYALDLGLKNLYETGFFSDVSLTMDAGVLTVHLIENPSINEVIFEGNDAIEKEDLEKEITLRNRGIYTRTKVQNDLQRLLDIYRRHGRYSAQITPQMVELKQNRINLIYTISEGPKAYIEHITFIGNATYDSRTLEKTITSEREHWYNFLSDNDKYDPDRLQYDQEQLRRFYLENGYADFKIKSAIAELSPQRDAFHLTFTIEEGEPYTVGKTTIDSKLPVGKMPDLAPLISNKTGATYNATEVNETIDKMVDALGDAGFAFVNIEPRIQRRKGNILDVTYQVGEGQRVYVDRINIFGNLGTRDEVIRREFRLVEGDAYSTSKLKRTEQRLNNLGYFEKVAITNKEGSAPDKTDIDVEVTEKSTGQITFGAGFSTTDGPLADIGLKESNFLGRGQELRLRSMFAAKRQMYDIGFTEPYFLDRQVSAGFDIYKTIENYQSEASYDRNATGTVLTFGYALSEELKHQMRYSYEDSTISNVDDAASRYVRDQMGTNTTSMVGHSLILDKRDNKFSPTTGHYLRANQDFAGVGGDSEFIRHELQGEYYIPLAKRWTLASNAGVGNITGIGKDVRINERYYIGSQEIRGFSRAGIGPRDITTNDALGGNNYYTASSEVRFPLGFAEEAGVSGALFVDAASLWGIDSTGADIADSSNIRASTGAGIAWASPFGPIRLDFGKAIRKESYDEEELMRFSFGTRF